jgi:hypothetical protein
MPALPKDMVAIAIKTGASTRATHAELEQRMAELAAKGGK